MIQYKLIKEYPGSEKLGAIHWFQTDELGPSSNSIWKGTNFYNSHPQFWEKVEELDYEILKVKYSGQIRKLKQGEYRILDYGIGFPLDYVLENNGTIHSVKRLHDGEVFTIGDVVDGFSYNSRAIEGFILYGRKISIKQWGGHSEFEDIKKSKKTPLFTTEDGVSIFEGDDFFFPNTHVWVISKTTADAKMIHHVIEVNKYKTFSSEEKAEEYVLLNKPMLSLQDLLNVWGVSDEIGAYKTSLMFNKFEKLAKSKL